MIVVNHWNEIPEDYSVILTELSNGQKVDSRIYPYLQEMFDDMRVEGIYPIVREGYRTAEEQQAILDEEQLREMHMRHSIFSQLTSALQMVNTLQECIV